ncbi:hypothetical protein N7468_010821 [Penicillium chermesinum]|uniref:Amidase domain-containing protein n=1 Tax=Penicillium chermesinum TaxID=63820 RepID=A0A9W9N8D0_9EURO|nr:uncharacterized protein N7468_010821 [Penicillium chermesinum]KAJ5215142.1 hypothetical protein N7468_010821 [Penicillium chermesinum]
MRRCQGFKLEEASIDEIQAQMSHGTFTSAELLQCFLDRAYQTQPYLNAILQFNPDAFSIARMLDEERANGKCRGPLHGIPFIVKDNIASKDRLETTAGSWALLGNVVPRDAYVVHRMRQAGAVLLGKGSLSEWADMRSNNYSEGFTARGGQCRSAFNLTVNPGGSSTGPAVAVGANLVPIALGTETDGSVINPAQRNAIVGIKPTVGLTSRAGVIPESLHQDTVGTFGKTVRDAVYALDAIYGVDPRDNYTLAQSGLTPKGGYIQFLSTKEALQGAVFGLPWKSFWALGNPEQIAQLEELLKLIQAAGATIINGTDLPHYKQIVSPDGWNWDYGATRGFSNESEYSYIKVDFYNNLRDYLSEVNNTAIKSLEDLVQYNRDNYGSEGGFPGVHPAFGSGQDGLIASLESKGVMNETYFSALEFCRRTTREEGIDAALKYHNKTLDGLLVPPDVAQSIQIAAQAGYPVVTVPAGVSNGSGMPYGLAIMNTAFSEPVLIKYASAIEDLQKSTAIAATQKASPMSSSRLTRAPRHWGAGRPFIPRRSFTISVRRFSEPSASAVATSFLSRFQSLGPQIRTQVLDANQLQLLTLTLNRPSLFPDSPTLTNAALPALNTPVPPGYHLVYFTPAFLEDELGLDGTDASYNPQFPFTRRMWAGGEVTWPRDADGQPNPLRVGQEVRETTRVLSAEAKVVKKTGEDMIVELGIPQGSSHPISLISPASPPRATSSHVATQTTFAISTQGHTHSRSLVQSPVTLFRFSALTFNPHKIHYSLPWAREVEGHRDIVVHGPLNLISILDLWRDTQGKACEDPATAVPKRISYRATSPLYAGDRYSIHLTEKEAGASKVQIVGPEDAIAMKAEIE